MSGCSCQQWQLMDDSVEKVGFADRLNSRTISTGEPTHHIEWFSGPLLSFAARLLGWFEGFCFVQTHLSRNRWPLRGKFGQTSQVLHRGRQRELIGRATHAT